MTSEAEASHGVSLRVDGKGRGTLFIDQVQVNASQVMIYVDAQRGPVVWVAMPPTAVHVEVNTETLMYMPYNFVDMAKNTPRDSVPTQKIIDQAKMWRDMPVSSLFEAYRALVRAAFEESEKTLFFRYDIELLEKVLVDCGVSHSEIHRVYNEYSRAAIIGEENG